MIVDRGLCVFSLLLWLLSFSFLSPFILFFILCKDEDGLEGCGERDERGCGGKVQDWKSHVDRFARISNDVAGICLSTVVV